MSTCKIVRASLRRTFGSIHSDGYFLGMQRRVERQVPVIREQQFKRVFSRRQRQRGFGLTLPEMQDLVRDRQRRVEFEFARVRIDEQMMMAGIVEFDARRSDAHSLEPKAYRDGAVDLGAI